MNINLTPEKIDKLIEVLQPEPVYGEPDKYHTYWGHKTMEGLRETIKTILAE